MRQHFQDWMYQRGFEVDPLDSRLKIGHLWDWPAYFKKEIADDSFLYEMICEDWAMHLTEMDVALIVPCLTDRPMCIVDAQLIKANIYDLVIDEIGIRLDILTFLN